jgi:large subunit ribosomal protein L13
VSHLSYRTISANAETANKQWVVVDAQGQTLGRFASVVAYMLRGKHKTNFTPHADCGDNVIIINAETVTLSGGKWDEKDYIWHTGYPGGQRSRTASEVMKRKPQDMVEKAVRGMLPKNKLGRDLFRNLYVYAGNEHPHSAQLPKTIDINSIK